MRLVTASEMADLDRATIEGLGIPGAVLMELAGRGAADFYKKVLPDLPRRRIAILAGSGNNAGDGFVLARLFHGDGAIVQVVCLRPPERLKGDALVNFRVMDRLGVEWWTWNEDEDFDAQWQRAERSDVFIDAMLGTGLNSEVRGLYRQVIDAANASGRPILSVDVPSGLDCATGKPLGVAIRALATATFGLPKVGQILSPGEDYVGELHVVDIGIPDGVIAQADPRRWWLDAGEASSLLVPRAADTHKGHAGHAVVLAGSPGKTGAAAMVSEGAARAGAGLVSAFAPKSLNAILEVKLTETMTIPVPETADGFFSNEAVLQILDFLRDKEVLAMGPGIGTDGEPARLLSNLLPQLPCPAVLDADAVTIVAGRIDLLKKASAPLILTPHPGEMARLINGTSRDVQADRLTIAAEFSREHGVVLVLKGHRTVIAAPDGRLAINASGNPAMASGGMGDVLTGVIAGFVSQGLAPFEAACLGVYVHGAAADACVGGRTSRGLLATDLLTAIPDVIGRLEGCQCPD